MKKFIPYLFIFFIAPCLLGFNATIGGGGGVSEGDIGCVNLLLNNLAGDGVTDDTAAFQNVADTISNPGRICAPSGAYYLTDRINFYGKTITIDGNGPSVTKFIWDTYDGGIVYSTPDKTDRFEVNGISFITTKPGGGTAIRANWPGILAHLRETLTLNNVSFGGNDPVNSKDQWWTKHVDVSDGRKSTLTRLYGAGTGSHSIDHESTNTEYATRADSGAELGGFTDMTIEWVGTFESLSSTLGVNQTMVSKWASGTNRSYYLFLNTSNLIGASFFDDSNNQTEFYFDLPLRADATGTHDGSSGASVLTDSGESWATNQWVNYRIRNDTDQSNCIITSNTSTTITCSKGLMGGEDNDWDASDSYTIEGDVNKRIHIAAAFDASAASVAMYRDGQPVAETTGVTANSSGVQNSTADFNIGGLTSSIWPLDGTTAYARIWNDVRTDQEIADNYELSQSTEFNCASAGLVAHWPLDEDYNDCTSNGYNLTNQGTRRIFTSQLQPNTSCYYFTEKSLDVKISDSYCFHSYNAVWIDDGAEGTVLKGNTFVAVTNGIVFANAGPGTVVADNHVSASESGIRLTSGNQLNIHDNLIYKRTDYTYNSWIGIYLVSASWMNKVHDNEIILVGASTGSPNYAIFNDGVDNDITNNKFKRQSGNGDTFYGVWNHTNATRTYTAGNIMRDHGSGGTVKTIWNGSSGTTNIYNLNFPGVLRADLITNMTAMQNGSLVFCTDCTTTCGASGTGARAWRINGAYDCSF